MDELLRTFGNVGSLSGMADMAQTELKRLNDNLEETNKLKVLEIVMSMDPAEDPEMRSEAIRELRKYFF